MFSMRRNFRKPIVLAFLFVFLWMFVIHDDEYLEEEREDQEPPIRSVQKINTSPRDIQRRRNVEDVIFGQGILIARSISTVPQGNSELVPGSGSDVSSRTKTSDARLLRNGESDKVEFHEKGPKGAVNLVRVNENSDQDILEAEDYPVRYKNSIDEPQRLEGGNPPTVRENDSYSKGTFKEAHGGRFPPAWMRITDDISTYSAFWDDREQLNEGPVARILGALRLKSDIMHEENKFLWKGTVKEERLNCTCLLWYRGKREAHEGILKAHVFDEGRKVFGGTFFLCYPQGANNTEKGQVDSKGTNVRAIETRPYAVSLHPHDTVDAPHKLIYLNHNSVSNAYHPVKDNSSAVCVRALFGPYDDVSGIAQFVSYYNSVLNVSHFYFYDLAVAPQVYELIESYRGLGLAFEMFPWNLPTSEWGELWDMGSLISLNDCVYRSSGKHAFVAIVDLDEFIVPKKAFHGLAELYRNVLNFRRGNHGDAVLFSNVFFCLDFKESRSSSSKKNESFPIFEYTRRESRLWPPKTRSKMLVVPEAVVTVGHHMVHGFVSKTLTNRSSSKLFAVLHHYRVCEDIRLGMFSTGKEVLGQSTVRDLSMLQYKKVTMNSKTMKLFKKCIEGLVTGNS
ncbi:uncharacterized protein LOC135198757 [Macrobrachium nipponense]|uniref:uncharacterized protein LOC135198757 n=1 Tax=Macrobrachium nipponense TaxID=159736 RepID=UPI0030C8C710